VDFGGSLGSLYFQHRSWLAGRGDVEWRVVEQPQFVEIGRREFAAPPLSFHATLAEACLPHQPDGIILSSVLPYLEEPEQLLADIIARAFSFVIVDRTGFVTGPRNRLTVQRVPEHIYRASYPCWFFARTRFLDHFRQHYTLKAEFTTADQSDIVAEFRGMYFERRA
jgi:putative methyltransferase (TIGR04325 family)